MNQRLVLSSALASALALGLVGRLPPRTRARKSATASPRPARTTAPTWRARIPAPASPRSTTTGEWKYVAKGTCKDMKGMSADEAKMKAKKALRPGA
jgi:uncharacterized membrane protein